MVGPGPLVLVKESLASVLWGLGKAGLKSSLSESDLELASGGLLEEAFKAFSRV